MITIDTGMISMPYEYKTEYKGFVLTASFELMDSGLVRINICAPCKRIYGLGEKFDSVNHKGKKVTNVVSETFCNQGEATYCSIPFFMTDADFGVLLDTKTVSSFDFTNSNLIVAECTLGTKVVLFFDTKEGIVRSLNQYIGLPSKCPASFSFGPWISANHWNCDADVDRVINELDEYGFPASVMVLEAWSDEATFYIFNGAKYIPKENGEAFSYEDFDFSESSYWSNPKEMIEKLHSHGISVVLWQIPVYKKMEDGVFSEQNELDKEDAVNSRLCVFDTNDNPYAIPEGNWFGGSLIPDFTNPLTVKKWFDKRRYLLDIGVDGFKTDGGEFIYRDDLKFFNNDTGLEQKNAYSQTYIDSYKKFVGENRVLFSRAGYIGAGKTPFIWAGDHQSTNDELKHAFTAAMSSSDSGILYWSFDIGGFAGPLPTKDVYLRSTMFSCFCPVMQWHSEPDGGQFKDVLPGGEGNNERSPWNIAGGDSEYLNTIRYFHNLRMNLLPYICEEAKKSADTGIPMMRPLHWYINENIDDEYYFGESLLVAPLLNENEVIRRVYLPEGKWKGFFSNKLYEGNKYVSSEDELFPVFVKNEADIKMKYPLERLYEKNLKF